MIIRAQINEAAAKLRAAVDERLLDREDSARAGTLLQRIDQPARVAAIGQRGSGKTTLLNALIGENCMPDISGPATVALAYGNEARFSCHDKVDNPISTAGQVKQKHLERGCEHLVQKLPLEHLQNRCFTEIQLPATSEEQTQILEWMTGNIDIVIWCTEEFNNVEHSIWSKAPDAMKDHGFLALTYADILMADGRLQQVTERFENQFADEFMGLYPVASKHALSACEKGRISDEKLWQASGAAALAEVISRDVESGKQADLDYADILLSRRLPTSNPTKTGTQTNHTDGGRKAKTLAEAAPPASSPEVISPMKRGEAIATALTVLQAPVDEMLRNIESNTPEPSSVLEHTSQAAQALATLFMDANTDDREISMFRENVLECEQLVLLLQHEGTEAAACDAATALLQLKKEMSEAAFA